MEIELEVDFAGVEEADHPSPKVEVINCEEIDGQGWVSVVFETDAVDGAENVGVERSNGSAEASGRNIIPVLSLPLSEGVRSASVGNRQALHLPFLDEVRERAAKKKSDFLSSGHPQSGKSVCNEAA